MNNQITFLNPLTEGNVKGRMSEVGGRMSAVYAKLRRAKDVRRARARDNDPQITLINGRKKAQKAQRL